jgi:hypothetical protein
MSGGQTESVHFSTLEAFQQWYGGTLTAAAGDTFVNVPLAELDGEYLVVRPSSVIGIRVEPLYGSDDA